MGIVTCSCSSGLVMHALSDIGSHLPCAAAPSAPALQVIGSGVTTTAGTVYQNCMTASLPFNWYFTQATAGFVTSQLSYMITASATAGFGTFLGTGANPVGGITLPLRSVVVQSNSMTPNMWMGLADTGVSPAISTVAIKTCYTTVATSQFAQTVVCTSSSTGLYLPVCPTTVPTFATSGTTAVSTTGTCYNSECQLVCVLMRHMTCFVPLC